MSDEREGSAGVAVNETGHWAGVGGVGLVVLGVAVATRTSPLVLVAAVLLVYTVAAKVSRPPGGADTDRDYLPVTLERKVDPAEPEPGSEVEVTVSVANTDDAVLSDLRIVDGVPPELTVVDGSPRHSDVLSPETTTTFTYTVVATLGEFAWEPATVVVSDPGNSFECEVEIGPTTTMTCRGRAARRANEAPPVRELTTPYPGRVETDQPGDGIEFHTRREYRPGDPPSRIDWKHRAKTGEFATIDYREEQLARVMLVVDSRRAAFLAPEPFSPHAVQRSVRAASHLFESLLHEGHQAGLSTFGPWDRDCWLTPNSGRRHRTKGRDLLETHPAFSPTPPDNELFELFPDDREEQLERKLIARLHHRLSPSTQIVFLSPCCDGYTASIVEQLHAYGHPVTVVSPDPTVGKTPVHELVRMEREDRLAGLRRRNVRVLDWDPDEPFEVALPEASRRWTV